ncbi:MAG: hypothetical protein HYY17_05530 [Planctomycetes bacterium]|nr:hypothetical protein [Planctomycetota bacterium]
MQSVGEGKARRPHGALKHAVALVVAAPVLLAAILGRADQPSARPPRAKVVPPAPKHVTELLPARVATVSGAEREGTSRHSVGANQSDAGLRSACDASNPLPVRARALKTAFQRRVELFYEMAARTLDDPELGDYALRLLLRKAPVDPRAREVLALWLSKAPPDASGRALALAAGEQRDPEGDEAGPAPSEE